LHLRTSSSVQLASGAASLYLDEQGDYQSEDGWSRSGGGISKYESEPAYQSSVQSTGKRTIPDVSYNADPATGFWIYDSVASDGWLTFAGTSAGAPQWAALVALADQQRALSGLASLDGPTQTLPGLYRAKMSDAFLDVTTGSNGYDAGLGYDYVTGLGSPWAPSVVRDLALVDGGSNATLAPGRQPSRALLPTTAAAPLMSTALQIALGAKNAVDVAFVEPSFAVATIAANREVPTVAMVHAKTGAMRDASLPGSLIDRLFGSDGPVTITLD
jgi:hypothetical protein